MNMNGNDYRELITKHFQLYGESLERFIRNVNMGCGCFDWGNGTGNCAYCRLRSLLKTLNK